VHQRVYIVSLRNGFELKAVNTFDFLLEDLIHEAVLLDNWDSLKRRARNGNGVEGPTATRNILYEEFGGLEAI